MHIESNVHVVLLQYVHTRLFEWYEMNNMRLIYKCNNNYNNNLIIKQRITCNNK